MGIRLGVRTSKCTELNREIQPWVLDPGFVQVNGQSQWGNAHMGIRPGVRTSQWTEPMGQCTHGY